MQIRPSTQIDALLERLAVCPTFLGLQELYAALYPALIRVARKAGARGPAAERVAREALDLLDARIDRYGPGDPAKVQEFLLGTVLAASRACAEDRALPARPAPQSTTGRSSAGE